jgi:DNA gyrase/topoisomerase IV subunit B
MTFTHGDADGPLKVRLGPPTTGAGTEVTFKPSTETFTQVEFDYATLERRLRELAFLNSGVRIILTDARHAECEARGADLRGRARGLRALPGPGQDGDSSDRR